MSYAIEVPDNMRWAFHGMRFATKEEADYYVEGQLLAWNITCETRIVESEDPVNYKIEDGKLRSVL